MSTAALISEIGRGITEATGESRETLYLEQRFGLAGQRGNAFSILTAVRGTTSSLELADCPLNAAHSGCKPPSFAFGRGRDPCNMSQFFLLLLNKYINYPKVVHILGRLLKKI